MKKKNEIVLYAWKHEGVWSIYAPNSFSGDIYCGDWTAKDSEGNTIRVIQGEPPKTNRPWWDSWIAAIVISAIATAMILFLVLTALWHGWTLRR